MGACFAQDVIVTRDAKKINAKVTEVNLDNIRYRNFDNPDGPTYTLPKSQILSILYQNGTVETFDDAGKQAAQPDVVQPTPAVVNRRQPQTAQPLSNSIRDYPVYYAEYSRGRSLQTRGIILLISGGVMVGSGTALVLSAGGDDDATGVGGTAIIVGGACVIASVPVMITGGNKKRRAMHSYLQEVSELPAKRAPHLQLNVHGNGLGLAYVF
ncbi:MAG: hypothetical protein LBP64_08525 [Tannerella sp.]|nr:hypothetical protein [Tannerella sp.]